MSGYSVFRSYISQGRTLAGWGGLLLSLLGGLDAHVVFQCFQWSRLGQVVTGFVLWFGGPEAG